MRWKCVHAAIVNIFALNTCRRFPSDDSFVRLNAVVASLTTVTNLENVETLVKEPPSEPVIEKMFFHPRLHRYVTTFRMRPLWFGFWYVETTYDSEDVQVYAISCTYEACVKE